MATNKVFDLSGIALHNTKQDCWVVINGLVVDVTRFMEEHPGGEEVLMEAAGKDATKEFDDIGHSKAATELLRKYQVGVLRGSEDKRSGVAEEEGKKEGRAHAAITGSVLKDVKDDGRVFGLREFFVPLTIACVAFWYRYSSAMAGLAQ